MASPKKQIQNPSDSRDSDVAEGSREEVERALELEDRRHYEQMQRENKLDHKTKVNLH